MIYPQDSNPNVTKIKREGIAKEPPHLDADIQKYLAQHQDWFNELDFVQQNSIIQSITDVRPTTTRQVQSSQPQKQIEEKLSPHMLSPETQDYTSKEKPLPQGYFLSQEDIHQFKRKIDQQSDLSDYDDEVDSQNDLETDDQTQTHPQSYRFTQQQSQNANHHTNNFQSQEITMDFFRNAFRYQNLDDSFDVPHDQEIQHQEDSFEVTDDQNQLFFLDIQPTIIDDTSLQDDLVYETSQVTEKDQIHFETQVDSDQFQDPGFKQSSVSLTDTPLPTHFQDSKDHQDQDHDQASIREIQISNHTCTLDQQDQASIREIHISDNTCKYLVNKAPPLKATSQMMTLITGIAIINQLISIPMREPIALLKSIYSAQSFITGDFFNHVEILDTSKAQSKNNYKDIKIRLHSHKDVFT